MEKLRKSIFDRPRTLADIAEGADVNSLDHLLKAKQVWVPPGKGPKGKARKGYYRQESRTKKVVAEESATKAPVTSYGMGAQPPPDIQKDIERWVPIYRKARQVFEEAMATKDSNLLAEKEKLDKQARDIEVGIHKKAQAAHLGHKSNDWLVEAAARAEKG